MRGYWKYWVASGGLALLAACGTDALSVDSTGEEPTLPASGDGEIRGPGSPTEHGASGGAAGSGGTALPAEDVDLGGGPDSPSAGPSDGDGNDQGENVQPGTLTAGTWDDNLNFEHFRAYRSDLLQEGLVDAPPFTDAEHADANGLFTQPASARQRLDITLVIDTTGSMGDEISYLQREFIALSNAIEAKYPNAEQRWALVVYRDEGDEYVVRWFDFRTNGEDFRQRLAAQRADGGGDYPEASHRGLEAMNGLGWRTGESTARLAFWVADAPHHTQHAAAVAEQVRQAQALDIHIYPVASSGVDELTEITMRSAAQLTGGRYLFLTSDSGVGGPHKEPTIPCYFVTRLDHAILRMVDVEMTGEYREPEASHVIRTGGDPQDGACTLQSGDQVAAF